MRLQLGRTPRAIEQRLRTEWARFPGASNDATRRRQPAPVRRRRPPRYRPRPRRTSGRHGRRTRRLASPCVPRRARRSPPVRRRPGLRRRRCRQRSRPPLRRVVAKCPSGEARAAPSRRARRRCVRFLQLRRRNHIGSAAPTVVASRTDDHMGSAPVFELAGDSDADASLGVSGAAQKPGTQAVGDVRQFHHAVGAAVRVVQAGEVRAVDEIDGAGSLVRLARVSPVRCADHQVFPAIAVPIADGDAVARPLVGCGTDKLPRILLARHVPQADDAVRCAIDGVRLGETSARDQIDGPVLHRRRGTGRQ